MHRDGEGVLRWLAASPWPDTSGSGRTVVSCAGVDVAAAREPIPGDRLAAPWLRRTRRLQRAQDRARPGQLPIGETQLPPRAL